MADGVCLKVSKANYFAAAIHADGEEKGTRIIFQSLRMLRGRKGSGCVGNNPEESRE